MGKWQRNFNPPEVESYRDSCPASSNPANGKRRYKRKYATLSEAAAAARSLGITTARDYYLNYEKDPLLPADPENYYGRSAWRAFGGWPRFLGKI